MTKVGVFANSHESDESLSSILTSRSHLNDWKRIGLLTFGHWRSNTHFSANADREIGSVKRPVLRSYTNRVAPSI